MFRMGVEIQILGYRLSCFVDEMQANLLGTRKPPTPMSSRRPKQRLMFSLRMPWRVKLVLARDETRRLLWCHT